MLNEPKQSIVDPNFMITTASPEKSSNDQFRYEHARSVGGGAKFRSALTDVASGLALWPLWVRLGWNDILQRYRRSFLGPFWLTASMAIMVIALGVLYAEIFRTPIREFLPFVCVGLLVWTFLSSFLVEGGSLFVGAESYIKQIRLYAGD